MNLQQPIIQWMLAAMRQPSWVTKIALGCAAAVIVIPLLALTLAALVVGGIVFAVLMGVVTISLWVRSLWNGLSRPNLPGMGLDDGRRNVRVIRR